MGLLGGLVAILGKVVALLTALLGLFWQQSVVLLGGLLGVLWGKLLVVGLMGVATILNLLGVDDVAGTLHRKVRHDGTTRTDPVERVDEVSADAVTDDAGRFSPEAFSILTGMTPAEFVHLYVTRKGGRVRQGTLTACLPWSEATVSRLLDTLEEEGVVKRVDLGRENVVCTLEAVPDVADD